MSKYKAVLFDLDGTIMDTSEGILMSIREAAEILGLPELEPEVLKTFIGPPVEWSFEDKYDIHGDDLKKAAATFRDRYSNVNLLHAKPYEGIFDLFLKLREKGIGTAMMHGVMLKCKELGIEKCYVNSYDWRRKFYN